MQENLLVGRPSSRWGPYSVIHDHLYGPHLSSEERQTALASRRIYRESGLIVIPTPRSGIVDPEHFSACVKEEYIRRPEYLKGMRDWNDSNIWTYFLPLWQWYFPGNYLKLSENSLLVSLFGDHCRELHCTTFS